MRVQDQDQAEARIVQLMILPLLALLWLLEVLQDQPSQMLHESESAAITRQASMRLELRQPKTGISTVSSLLMTASPSASLFAAAPLITPRWLTYCKHNIRQHRDCNEGKRQHYEWKQDRCSTTVVMQTNTNRRPIPI